MTDTDPAVPDPQELRAKLRAAQAKTKAEEARHAALTQALDKARSQQRSVRDRLFDAEASIQQARRDERTARVYAFMNGGDGVDLLDSGGAEIKRLHGDLEKLQGLEADIAAEIARVEANLRSLHNKVFAEMAEVVINNE